ncbi:alpha/beta hydrolase [Dokdonia sp.]|uniref:alpha/beta fold hydrolase n=1 Tax=Dokdonia sp. TaxID=2024995 RepID=UPI00326527DA
MRSEQITYDTFRAQQQSFSTTEGAIKYIDKGEGPVILLLHGVPTSGWLYRKMIDPLVDGGYRVIAPDMLGFGNSDSPKGYEIYSEEMHAQRLLELMNHLAIDSWTHVMHDAGGLWTWELMEQAPDKIKNLAILNTIIYEEGFDPPIRFEAGIMARMAMWGYRNGITTNVMLKGLFKEGLTENNLNKIDVEGYKRPLKEGKTRAMYYFFTQTCNSLPEYQPMIQKMDIPATIIWGKNDSFLKLEPQQEVLQKDLNIKDEDIHLLEAKHFIQEEKPEEIAQMILEFIK